MHPSRITARRRLVRLWHALQAFAAGVSAGSAIAHGATPSPQSRARTCA